MCEEMGKLALKPRWVRRFTSRNVAPLDFDEPEIGHSEIELTDALFDGRVLRGDLMKVAFDGNFCHVELAYLGMELNDGDRGRHYFYDFADEKMIVPERIDRWQVIKQIELDKGLVPRHVYVPTPIFF